VAVLGSLLALSGTSPLHYSLGVPLTLAAAVLVLASALAWVGTREESTARERVQDGVPT
jgi:hypothetical protein